MIKLESYANGAWHSPSSSAKPLFNAINGEAIAEISSEGVDYKATLEYARTVGGQNLRKYTLHERARMVKALAFYLMERKDRYYELSKATGATKMDSWVDIEGGIGTLFTAASKVRREMLDEKFDIDGPVEHLSKEGTYVGRHIYTPLQGAAIHINAFNFPIWGMLEKVAPTICAGMPVIVKPASLTAYLAEAMAHDIIESKILPEGSFNFISGSVGDMLDHVMHQDVVTLTGSAYTGNKLRSKPSIVENSVRFNMEADSLNFSMLGEEAAPGTPEFDLFIKEIQRELTIKSGQRCTAVRRTIVPEKYAEDVVKALGERLSKYPMGDPSVEGVKMGPLAGKDQVEDVKENLKKLLDENQIVYGDLDNFDVVGADKEKGSFFPQMLLMNDDPFNKTGVHSIEAFGPISTVIPYKNVEEAVAIAKMGEGSLVGSIFTNDNDFAQEIMLGTASYHGRLHYVNRDAKENTGHGSPLPHMVHGGPGRAGGGEEQGGIRAVKHYMQRSAIQASPTQLMALTKNYVTGAARTEDVRHPFTKYFEELEIGDSLTTHKRTVTETDIVNFTGISWDNFYAHTDTTSIDDSIFERRVAHGYFVISAAAGLFVNPKPGPVLANYGLDELRFTQPVYAGDTIYTKLTVDSKQKKERREDDDKWQGVVKWLVEVFNQEEEIVALATILTLVERQGE